MILWVLALAMAQEPVTVDERPREEPPSDQRVLLAWEGGACTQALGKTGHHLVVKGELGLAEPVEENREIREMLDRVTAQTCGEEGLGYTCDEPEKPGARSRTMERGQRVNGLLRLPVSRWLTGVTITLHPKVVEVRYVLYAEGPGPGDESWLWLCNEGRRLIAAAKGEVDAE